MSGSNAHNFWPQIENYILGMFKKLHAATEEEENAIQTRLGEFVEIFKVTKDFLRPNYFEKTFSEEEL